MRSAVREYGLIVAVIAAAMIGYLFYNQNKDAVIDYALDNIGERLVSLVVGESNRDAIRDKFAALKSRILDDEVEPDAVEQMAANVLNLSAAGSPITMEEAEMLLDEVNEKEWKVLPEPQEAVEAGAGVAPQPDKRRVKIQIEALGDHLARLIEAEKELSRMAKASGAEAPLPPFVVVNSDEGLRFQVDSMMVEVFSKEKASESLRELQKQDYIVWKKHLAEQRKVNQEKVKAELEYVREHLEEARQIQTMAISQAGEEIEVSVQLAPEIIEKIKVLKELESKGVWIPAVPDSIQKIVISRVEVEAPPPPPKPGNG